MPSASRTRNRSKRVFRETVGKSIELLKLEESNLSNWLLTMWFSATASFYAFALELPGEIVALSGLFVFLGFRNEASNASSLLAERIRSTPPHTWEEEDRRGYRLGQKSINWQPYLQSFGRKEAYTTAFQVGLEDALKKQAEEEYRIEAQDLNALRNSR